VSLMGATADHDGSLGPLLCRHEGVVLTGGALDRFMASDTPWMVLDVHSGGIRIQSDPRMASRIRRIANAVLGPFGPGGFVRLSQLSQFQPVTWAWGQLASVRSNAAKVVIIQSHGGGHIEFRFGSSRGMKDTFAKLAESEAPRVVKVQAPVN
jgi:hypothetical protein